MVDLRKHLILRDRGKYVFKKDAKPVEGLVIFNVLLRNFLLLDFVSCFFVPSIKVALYSYFGARGIGTNGASARVFKKDFYFDDVTENKGF